MINTKILLTLILSWSLTFSESPIPWSKDKKLVWADFKASPPKLDSHVALSRVEVRYESQVDKAGKMTMDIQSVFIRELSWVKPEGKNDHVLNHEQYHFHLAEIWARKLRQEITSKKWNTKTYEKEFNNLFKKLMGQLLKEQLRYDNETNHSKLIDKQLEWQQRIDEDLTGLKAHANTKVPFLFE